MSRWISIVMVAALAGTLALPAEAQWKWRDRGGQTQYSDLPPPPGVPESDILQRPAGASRRNAAAAAAAAASAATAASAASTAALPGPRGSDPELEARRKKAEQDVIDKKKADDAKVAAARADNCTRAKAQMRTLDSGIRIARTNDKGEREFMDDAARAAETRRTRETISSDCQ